MGLRKVRYRREAFAEVNMTNLIDIVMVLLIVFILVSNFVTTGLEIKIPEISYVEPTGKEAIVIGLDINRVVTVRGEVVALEDLLPRMIALKEEYPDEMVFIQADEAAAVGDFMEIISIGKQAKFEKFGLPARLKKDQT